MNRLNLAIIGAGQVARKSHIPAYYRAGDVNIVGVCDTNINAAKQLAEEFNIPYYCESYKQLLEQCKPDAVSVCVPNKFHYPIVMDALRLGCHVMCEKPPAINYGQALEMAETSQEKGLILTYDFHMRHSYDVAALKEKIQNNELGVIYFSKIIWNRKAGVPGWGNFINKDMQGGGPLIDIGAHVLDLAFYLLDYPKIKYVSATWSDRIGKTHSEGYFGAWDPNKYTVEDGLFGMISFENGTSLQIETTFALNMEDKDKKQVVLYGDKAGGSLYPAKLYYGSDENFNTFDYGKEEANDLHTKAILDFVDACRYKRSPLVNAKQGAYIQKVIELLYKSADANMPVSD